MLLLLLYALLRSAKLQDEEYDRLQEELNAQNENEENESE